MLRDEILNYVESQFMGPSRGYPHQLDYIKDYMPYQHLVTGMLFPQESIVDSDHTISQDAAVVDSEVDPLSLSFTYLTAVVGMSINIPTHIKKINIKCSASYYELIEIEKEEASDKKREKEKYWERNDLDEENIIVELKDHEIMIFNDKAKIDVRVFESNSNKLVTITIINNARKEKRGKVKQVDVLSRVAMSCWITGDNILPYPKVFRSTMDGEEEEQQVLYKDEHIYGVGHACSVKWENTSEDNMGNIISLDFIPTGVTRGSKSTLSEYKDSKAISMEFLANPANKQHIIKEMRAFVGPYKAWIDQTIEKLKALSDSTNQKDYFEINESHKKAIGSLIDKLGEALKRINIGIDFDMWCAYFAGRNIVPIKQSMSPYWRVVKPTKQVMFSMYHLNKDSVKSYIDEINKSKLPWIHGYPSTISYIASMMLEQNLHINHQLTHITTGAESLLQNQKELIKRAFGIYPTQHYGLAEPVANISQCKFGKLHIDEDYSHLELIPLDGFKNKYKIVGTSFTNDALMFLRYDTNDIVSLSQNQTCKCKNFGRIIDEIDGRKEDFLLQKDGTKVGRLDHIFKDMINVKEAQIKQFKNQGVIFYVVKNDNYKNYDEIILQKEIESRLNIDYEIEYLNKIKRTKSGKLKFVVSEI